MISLSVDSAPKVSERKINTALVFCFLSLLTRHIISITVKSASPMTSISACSETVKFDFVLGRTKFTATLASITDSLTLVTIHIFNFSMVLVPMTINLTDKSKSKATSSMKSILRFDMAISCFM